MFWSRVDAARRGTGRASSRCWTTLPQLLCCCEVGAAMRQAAILIYAAFKFLDVRTMEPGHSLHIVQGSGRPVALPCRRILRTSRRTGATFFGPICVGLVRWRPNERRQQAAEQQMDNWPCLCRKTFQCRNGIKELCDLLSPEVSATHSTQLLTHHLSHFRTARTRTHLTSSVYLVLTT